MTTFADIKEKLREPTTDGHYTKKDILMTTLYLVMAAMLIIEFLGFLFGAKEFIFSRTKEVTEYQTIIEYAPNTYKYFIGTCVLSILGTFINNFPKKLLRAVINSVAIIALNVFAIFLVSHIDLVVIQKDILGFPHYLFISLVIFTQATIFLFVFHYQKMRDFCVYTNYAPHNKNTKEFYQDLMKYDDFNMSFNKPLIYIDRYKKYLEDIDLQKNKLYKLSKNPFKPIF